MLTIPVGQWLALFLICLLSPGLYLPKCLVQGPDSGSQKELTLESVVSGVSAMPQNVCETVQSTSITQGSQGDRRIIAPGCNHSSGSGCLNGRLTQF